MTPFNDICPVCGMHAEAAISSVEYAKMYFHFCSEQCRETFVLHPRLYSTKVGEKSKERFEILKQRTMRLAEPLSNEVIDLLIPEVKKLMGVRGIVIVGNKINITYDLLQVTEEKIQQVLCEVGVQLGGDWLERLRRAWVHDCEEIELDNLAAPPVRSYNYTPPKV